MGSIMWAMSESRGRWKDVRGRVSNGAGGWENECCGLGNDHLCSGGGRWDLTKSSCLCTCWEALWAEYERWTNADCGLREGQVKAHSP